MLHTIINMLYLSRKQRARRLRMAFLRALLSFLVNRLYYLVGCCLPELCSDAQWKPKFCMTFNGSFVLSGTLQHHRRARLPTAARK